MPQYVAALDQGTTSTRCLLFDRQGRMVALAQEQHQQHYPQPGWVEHDAEEIWQITRRLIPRALADAGADPKDVIGLGVTNQRETIVVWERDTGRPVGPAIVWQDTRTSDRLETLTEGMAPAEITRRTGLPLSTYPSGPRLRWLLDRDERLRERAEGGSCCSGRWTAGSSGTSPAACTSPT